MKNFLKKRRELVAVMIYVILIAVAIYLIITVLLRGVNNRRDQVQEELANQEASRQRLSELPKIRQRHLAVKEKESDMAVFFDKDDAVTLIEELEKLAENTHNEIKISVVENDTTTANATGAAKNKTKKQDNADVSIIDNLPQNNYLEMKITLSGDFNSIVHFISQTEEMRYFNDIVSLNIKTDDSQSENSGTAAVKSGNPFEAKNDSATVNAAANNGQQLTGLLDMVFYFQKD